MGRMNYDKRLKVKKTRPLALSKWIARQRQTGGEGGEGERKRHLHNEAYGHVCTLAPRPQRPHPCGCGVIKYNTTQCTGYTLHTISSNTVSINTFFQSMDVPHTV